MRNKILFLLIALSVMLGGCANTSDQDAKSILQTMEFEGDEYGTVKLTGEISLGAIPFFSTKVHLDYEKTKDAPLE